MPARGDRHGEEPLPSPVVPGSSAGPAAEARAIIVLGDALEIDYADLAAVLASGTHRSLRVIGNLPYAVGTALIRRMVEARERIDDAMIMVQKEVADRILAEPSSKPYGLLSVLIALHADRRRVMVLEPSSFSPPPNIRSSVVSLRFHRPAAGDRDEDARLLRLLKAAFSERRKMVARNLAKHYGLDRRLVEDSLRACGVPPSARAEDLPPSAYLQLASRLPSADRPSRPEPEP
jgi:16S rRNA (adenine1518-N6/adenine1519-N6)-dimethyltransferase